jgi:rubrerythrin
MGKKNDKYDTAEDTTIGAPVCEECGNILIKESSENSSERSFGSAQDKPHDGIKQQDSAVWVCPHCQGEIDFLGDDDE